MEFKITDRDGKARAAFLSLDHGPVETPAFMPVGTNATVKAVRVDDLEDMGVRLILSNAYHLYLRPGVEVIKAAGGLHSFMGWKHNILTDSGGFQVFSLASLQKLTEDGVWFRSHIDGSAHTLTPEKIVEIQCVLGSDIMMPLDICTPAGVSYDEAEEAAQRTNRWAARSLSTWQELAKLQRGELFAIVQGNFYKDLREKSAGELTSMDFPGYALGGLSVGEGLEKFRELLAFGACLLPENKPRYVMGIGTPEYVLEAVENGIDLFDCVYPTRIARNALALTRQGPLSLRWEKNRLDQDPIDPECECGTCRRYSRSYLRHLFKAKEILASVLTTHHNLTFMENLIGNIRGAIERGDFHRFKEAFIKRYTSCR